MNLALLCSAERYGSLFEARYPRFYRESSFQCASDKIFCHSHPKSIEAICRNMASMLVQMRLDMLMKIAGWGKWFSWSRKDEWVGKTCLVLSLCEAKSRIAEKNRNWLVNTCVDTMSLLVDYSSRLIIWFGSRAACELEEVIFYQASMGSVAFQRCGKISVLVQPLSREFLWRLRWLSNTYGTSFRFWWVNRCSKIMENSARWGPHTSKG